jgi:hypothetical protein
MYTSGCPFSDTANAETPSPMKKKVLKRSKLEAQSQRLFAALIKPLRSMAKERDSDGTFTSRSAEEMCIAALAALLSCRNHNKQPRDLLPKAFELLAASKKFMADKRLPTITIPLPLLTPREAMRALGYKHSKSLWDAVERTFDAEKTASLKTRRKFDMGTLAAISRRNAEGKMLRARKARDAKRRTGRPESSCQ